jgi:hypothetical protein
LLSEVLQPPVGAHRLAMDRVLKPLDHALEVRDTFLQRTDAVLTAP